MILNLSYDAVLELGDRPGKTGLLEIFIDDMPSAEGHGAAGYVNRDEAIKIIWHLRDVFGVEE